MKGNGHLNTIIEVPSEQSVSGSAVDTVRSDGDRDSLGEFMDRESFADDLEYEC